MKKDYLIQAWLVLLLAVVFGVSLAFVENVTRPRIRQNEEALIARRLVDMFGDGTTTTEPEIIKGAIAGRGKKIPCYPAVREGHRVGWGILATGQGYDTLTLLIGVDAEVKVLKGYRVIKSLETAGIGDKINKEKSDFYKQFEGKNASRPFKPAAPGKQTAPQQTGSQQTENITSATIHAGHATEPGKQAGPQRISTISGATISSKGVTNIINDNLAAVREKLINLGKEGVKK